ncbi:MAG TPA: NACHT domain-containing protein [Anaerolineales bacterium]|nr:NACHT domain-containing protein [Anaerolineales bacterium]
MGNQNDTKGNLLIVILYMAIGGTGAQLIKEIWMNNPNKTVAGMQIAIVVLVALILSSIIQIVTGIKDNIVEKVNEALRNRLFFLFDRYEQKFLHFVEEDFRFLELRGIGKTDLDRFLYIKDAFIHLSFTRKLEDDKDNFHFDGEMSDSLTTSIISEPVYFNEELIPALRNGCKIMILGAPGSGKSTLIQYIAYICASNRLKLFPRRKLLSKIPFAIKLRELGKKIVSENISLPEAIKLAYDRKLLEIPTGWYADKLSAGSCLILLDGLDEVPGELSRISVSKWVQNNIRVYDKCSFLITSRPHGRTSENRIPDVDELKISDLSDEQINAFITQWHIANRMRKIPVDRLEDMDEANLNKAKRTAQELIAKVVGNPLYGKIITNPLLLTMIIIVDYFNRALPGQRVELYKEMILVSLHRRYREIDTASDLQEKEIYPLNDIQKIDVLEQLGFQLMDINKIDIRVEELLDYIEKALKKTNSQISKEDFLKIIEQEHGLLIEKRIGIYEFSHKSFQEYFAASYIVKMTGEEYLYDKLNDGGWNETIRLFVALADGTFVLRKVREQDAPTSEVLSLAIDTLDEAKNLDETEKQEFERWLDEMAKNASEEKRGLIAKAKLYSRIRGMQSLESNISVDKGLISNLEYQYFLDEMRKRDVYLYPDHWQTYTYPNSKNAEPVLGIRGEDAAEFCEWLTHLDKNATVFALPTANQPSVVHKMDQTFWIQDQGKSQVKYHVCNPEKQSRTFTPEEIRARIVKDASLAVGVVAADERRNTTPVKTSILLARTHILPEGSGDSQKKTGAFMSHFEALSTQRYLEGRFLEKCEAFSYTYDIALVEHVKHLNSLTTAKDSKESFINEKWLEPVRIIYPFEFISIGQHAQDFLDACKAYRQSRGVIRDQVPVIDILMNSLNLMITRDWDKKGNLKYSDLMEVAKQDQEKGTFKYKEYDLKMTGLKPEKSDFLRWLVRVTLTYLGANIRFLLGSPEAMEIRRDFLRAITKFYLAMMFLDAQVDELPGFLNVGIKIQMKDFRKG